MTLNPSLMRNLDNRELLRFLESGDDPLTTTDLERELTRRLSDAQDEIDELQVLVKSCGDHDADDIRNLLETLSEFNAESQDSLRDKLKRADEFYDIAQDAGDFLERMNNLVKTTL